MSRPDRSLTTRLARTTGVLALSTCLVGTLAACGSSADAQAGSTGKDGTIYLVPGLTTHPAYRTMYCGAKAEADKLGLDLEYAGATTWDPSLQIPIVQSLLAKSPAALLLTPTDGAALAPVVQQYTSADIPVIAMDTTLDDPKGLTSQISSSNEQGGAAAADALGEAVGDSGTVAIISGAPGASTDEARVKGFVDRMKSEHPGLTILEPQFSKSVVATAESQTQALMLKHPDLVGVFGVNGNSATGAANAVDNGGKKGEITVAGYDAEPATVEELKAGNIAILVVQDFATEGKLGVRYAAAALSGDEGEIEKQVALKNVIATTDNADDLEISRYFYVDKCS
ncbi:monosaccharide ABC transporter substrate-binding protein, CUT2 family [Nocardioides scoriae]|uniref:Monosaccharide ABC transporter substrate-binding protein, CUT2 family n=1 Tax=Nocardioides scoriae TaxID=642780 RepID=A0A1H1PFA6_9ACTN|nr:ABC transporter substrate-binding protein [Nocardioides scoriae]SDS09961.1 monosaccharide ABC transporter substrate-binding protein, CUT2 family [Nocardioides scoriae]